jgi:CspA family cold shock protein
MPTGTVKWFNDAKGFGFIAPDDKGADLFVHHTAILGQGFRTLHEGQRVTFEAVRGPKGMQASQVQSLE